MWGSDGVVVICCYLFIVKEQEIILRTTCSRNGSRSLCPEHLVLQEPLFLGRSPSCKQRRFYHLSQMHFLAHFHFQTFPFSHRNKCSPNKSLQAPPHFFPGLLLPSPWLPALLGTGTADIFPFNGNFWGLEIQRAPQSISRSSAGGCCGHCIGEESSRNGKTVASLGSEELPGFSGCLFQGLSSISRVFALPLCISSAVHERWEARAGPECSTGKTI